MIDPELRGSKEERKPAGVEKLDEDVGAYED